MAKAEDEKPKLPNMNEFSPGVLNLGIRALLLRLSKHLGSRDALVNEIALFPSIAKTPALRQRQVRSSNVLIGMSQCGLFDLPSNQLTELGIAIRDAATSAEAADMFAAHILHNLHGLRLVSAVESIRAQGGTVSLEKLRRELEAEGFIVTHNEGNASKLRQWMEESGVVDKKWMFDDEKLRELGGMDRSALHEVESLSLVQRVFLNAFWVQARLSASDAWIDLGEVKDLVEQEHGRHFLPEGQLRQKVLDPLESMGWIECRGRGGGRGGKIGFAKAKQKLLDLSKEVPLPNEAGIPVELRGRLDTPIEQILADLEDDNKHKAGLALELLALRVLLGIGLQPVGFRERAAEAANAEVDLTANGIHLHYSRWLVQCKNTERVSTHHLAREVGLALVLRAQVVLMITTGDYAASTVRLAEQVARTTHLQVFLIDGDVLERYRHQGPRAIREVIRAQADYVLAMKQAQDTLTITDAPKPAIPPE